MPRKRPKALVGKTYEYETGCGTLYVVINRDDIGIAEIFSKLGKTGGCGAAVTEGLSRLAVLALRNNATPQSIIKHLKGITCWRENGFGLDKVLSCPDAIGKAIELNIKEEEVKNEGSKD
jgi:ribonucleoside-diphosphate reductase alpha chain